MTPLSALLSIEGNQNKYGDFFNYQVVLKHHLQKDCPLFWKGSFLAAGTYMTVSFLVSF